MLRTVFRSRREPWWVVGLERQPQGWSGAAGCGIEVVRRLPPGADREGEEVASFWDKMLEEGRGERLVQVVRKKGGGAWCELIVIHHSFLMHPGSLAQTRRSRSVAALRVRPAGRRPKGSPRREKRTRRKSRTRSLAASIRDRSTPCFPSAASSPDARTRAPSLGSGSESSA